MAYNKVTAERNRRMAAKAAKKTTVKKKATKKVAKRGRKIAPSKEAQLPLALPPSDTVRVTFTDEDFLVQRFNEVAPPTNSEILQEIEVLDIRNLSNPDRFIVVTMFSKEGYISNQSLKPHVFDVDQICAVLTSDAIRLNHNNKIATCISWGEAQMSNFISYPTVIPLEVDQEITFNFPDASPPPVIMISGKAYGRID